jgi:hypothetical protein
MRAVRIYAAKPMSSVCPTCRGRGTIRILTADPAVAEPAITSPQFPGQSATRHCALIITNPGPRKNGSISGRTRTHASAAAFAFRVVHFTVRSFPPILAPAPRGLLAAPSPSRKAAVGSGARPLHLLGSALERFAFPWVGLARSALRHWRTTDAVLACFNLYRSASRV